MLSLRTAARFNPTVIRSFNPLCSQLRLKSSDSKLPITDSFVMNMFRGKVQTDRVFPFPKALNTEKIEALGQMVDPVQNFLETENNAYKNDETEKFDPKTVEGLKELGAFGLQVPEKYGGIGLCNSEYARIVGIVGLTDLALGIFLGSHQSIGYKGIILYGTEEQKAKYLPDLASGKKLAAYCLTEPSHGSDAANIQTKAELTPDGKHYVLNGSKVWISNGGWADVFTVFAQVPTKQPDGTVKNKMSAFIVERGFGGLTHSEPEKKMGIKASNTVSLYFENCKVPVENLLGEPGKGFKVAVNILNQGRFGMAGALSGTMRTAIKKAVDHASQRFQFDRTIDGFESIKEKIAMMAMRHYTTEAMAFMISGIMDLGAQDFQLEAAISKVYASESAWFCVDEAIQVLGGMGFMKETELERFQRDLRIFRIFEGANDVLRLFIALTASQHAGKHLTAQAKSPVGVLQLAINGMKSKLGMSGCKEAMEKAVSPELKPYAKLNGEVIERLGLEVQGLLMKYKKGIIEEQFRVSRVADAAIGSYAMACGLSRADKAIREKSSTASYETSLAKLACLHFHKTSMRSLSEVSHQSHDEIYNLLRSLSKETVAAGGVVVKSPLGV